MCWLSDISLCHCDDSFYVLYKKKEKKKKGLHRGPMGSDREPRTPTTRVRQAALEASRSPSHFRGQPYPPRAPPSLLSLQAAGYTSSSSSLETEIWRLSFLALEVVITCMSVIRKARDRDKMVLIFT
jgi:hypothetical protein